MRIYSQFSGHPAFAPSHGPSLRAISRVTDIHKTPGQGGPNAGESGAAATQNDFPVRVWFTDRPVRGELLNPEHFVASRSWKVCRARLAVLFLHLLATVIRLARSGGATVVAESARQAPTADLNRSRTRSPNLRPADRVAGCAPHPPKPQSARDRHGNQRSEAPSGAEETEISPAVLAENCAKSRAPSHPKSRRRRDRNGGTELGLSANRSPDRLAFAIPLNKDLRRRMLAVRAGRHPTQQGRPGSRSSVTPGRSMESRSVSMRVGGPTHPLGARRDGPMDASHRGLWCPSRRRGCAGLCRMFNRATRDPQA